MCSSDLGVGARHVSELGVKSVWVGEAPDDPVADLGVYGADPSSTEFGAQNFYVERISYFPYSLKSHSSYWERESASIKNLGWLVTGQYDHLIPFPRPVPTPNPTPTPPADGAPQESSTLAHWVPSPRPAGG